MVATADKSSSGKGLRIASGCSNLDEFTAVFRKFCTPNSIFFATQTPRARGEEIKFAVSLKDGKIVMRGTGKVAGSFAGADNQYKRPGMMIEFKVLDTMGKILLAELNAKTPRANTAAERDQGFEVPTLIHKGEEETKAAPDRSTVDDGDEGEEVTRVSPESMEDGFDPSDMEEYVECTLVEEDSYPVDEDALVHSSDIDIDDDDDDDEEEEEDDERTSIGPMPSNPAFETTQLASPRQVEKNKAAGTKLPGLPNIVRGDPTQQGLGPGGEDATVLAPTPPPNSGVPTPIPPPRHTPPPSDLPNASTSAVPTPVPPHGPQIVGSLPAPGQPLVPPRVAGGMSTQMGMHPIGLQPPGMPSQGNPGPGMPAPGLAGVGASRPGIPAPGIPAPGIPAPGIPAPGMAATDTSGPGLPAPGFPGRGVPAPGFPGSGIPAPGFPAPGVPAPGMQPPGMQPPGMQPPGMQPPGMQLPDMPAPEMQPPAEARFRVPSPPQGFRVPTPSEMASAVLEPLDGTPNIGQQPGVPPQGAVPTPGEVPVTSPPEALITGAIPVHDPNFGHAPGRAQSTGAHTAGQSFPDFVAPTGPMPRTQGATGGKDVGGVTKKVAALIALVCLLVGGVIGLVIGQSMASAPASSAEVGNATNEKLPATNPDTATAVLALAIDAGSDDPAELSDAASVVAMVQDASVEVPEDAALDAKAAEGAMAVTPAVPDPGEPKAGECSLVLKLTPADALLVINATKDKVKVEKGATKANVPCGVFTTSITHPKYKGHKGRIHLKPGEVTTLEFALKSPSITLKITSSPSRALVSFGTEDVGRTPFSRLVPANEPIELKLVRSGYQPHIVTIVPGETPKLDYKLQRRRRGKRSGAKRKKPRIKL